MERAADEAGIPIEEAREWLQKRLSHVAVGDDLYLRKEMRKAIRKATATLHAIAEGGSEEAYGEQRLYFPHLKAAETLLKFGLATQKLLKSGQSQKGKEQGGQQDLFDRAAERGPWDLKDADEDG